jgi:hypothetical protein
MVKWVDGRAFAHHSEWECLNAGLYEPTSDAAHINKSAELLSDTVAFAKACERVVNEWPTSAAVHLSDTSRNRRAYMGTAACFITHGSSEFATKQSWWTIDVWQRQRANEVADEAIKSWETSNAEHFRKRSVQLAFRF